MAKDKLDDQFRSLNQRLDKLESGADMDQLQIVNERLAKLESGAAMERVDKIESTVKRLKTKIGPFTTFINEKIHPRQTKLEKDHEKLEKNHEALVAKQNSLRNKYNGVVDEHNKLVEWKGVMEGKYASLDKTFKDLASTVKDLTAFVKHEKPRDGNGSVATKAPPAQSLLPGNHGKSFGSSMTSNAARPPKAAPVGGSSRPQHSASLHRTASATPVLEASPISNDKTRKASAQPGSTYQVKPTPALKGTSASTKRKAGGANLDQTTKEAKKSRPFIKEKSEELDDFDSWATVPES